MVVLRVPWNGPLGHLGWHLVTLEAEGDNGEERILSCVTVVLQVGTSNQCYAVVA